MSDMTPYDTQDSPAPRVNITAGKGLEKSETLFMASKQNSNSPVRPVAVKEDNNPQLNLSEDLLTSVAPGKLPKKSETYSSTTRNSVKYARRQKEMEEFERKQAILNRHRYFLVKEPVTMSGVASPGLAPEPADATSSYDDRNEREQVTKLKSVA